MAKVQFRFAPWQCAVLFSLLLTLFAGPVLAATCTSGTPLPACTKITHSGTYCVNFATTYTASGDCFVISASSVILQMPPAIQRQNGSTIKGGGSGSAFHVLSTAANAQIYVGLNNTFAYFTNVVEDDGTGAYINWGDADGGGEPVETSIKYGVYFNHTSRGGLYTGGLVGQTAAVWINGGGQNVVTGAEAGGAYAAGGTYGVYIQNSSGNVMSNMSPSGSSAGIYISGGSGNTISDNYISGQNFGIRVTYTSFANIVIGNLAQMNSGYAFFQGTGQASDGATEALDSATLGGQSGDPIAACYNNFWIYNHLQGSATFSNQSCIQ